ncbi:hypothetical protein COCSUDRAFT_56593 [Coccomyxa subellipsoidea C-169]|uniref:Uncharacterized protein n=1 Tax=Coccomyxa subellipsoidea (strain C-169) TaxID=574566 RepID=I0YSK5_COCSC|nr:hypothetical protein COCSUDRAFT_56593 [Coccomyxa subellipsoidea C-169]EIE21374.1 hypothetical protein COCSUDRAFT_56593 [Coccomyxa subellipsoidea C-169]|eukprot:XP_005645918.1 hypothetical protein COCSUDRAFT_56593 [Coccomyxa subellipsoidea C-169]
MAIDNVCAALPDLEDKVCQTVEKKELDWAAVSEVFYREHFGSFADILLSVVAAEWLSSFSLEDKVQLFHAFFAGAPAAILLPTLVTHLSSVAPLREALSASEASVYVTAVAADTAAAILAERFALSGSTGIQAYHLVVQELAGSSGVSSDGANGGSLGGDSTAYLASLLASVPERAASTQLPALRPSAYIPQVVEHCLRAISSKQASSQAKPPAQQETAEANSTGDTLVSKSAMFVGEVLARLSRRGHAQLVAAALWSTILPKSASSQNGHAPARDAVDDISNESSADSADASARLRSHAAASTSRAPAAPSLAPAKSSHSRDAAALEKLLEALLREAARILEAGDLREADLAQSAHTLKAVLNGPLLARSEVRYFLEDKALMRRTLPPGQMRLLVRLLDSLGAPDQASSPDAPLPVLQHVAVRLAQAWGQLETTQRLPVRQQAYMSAALVEIIACLGRAELEGTPGLFAALLSGVSTRLNSPQVPIRRQGMRVGQAFSKVLDPSKDPLFSDLGDVGLLPEEAWHRDCLPSAVNQQGPSKSAAAIAAEPADNARGSSVQTPGDIGDAASDGSLEPYDLSEEDDDGLSEGDNPLQLRDVAALLRKGDDPNAVLKGLAALGPLVDAAPHELDSHAGELARALLHARPPEWADEEAAAAGRPDTGPAARRLAGMASLAAAAPRAGGLALAAEVYSPHVDLHQRLTLLEALAAAARQLASGGPQALPAPDASGGIVAAEADTRQVGKSRVWGMRSLAKQKEAAPRTHRNRFVDVAAEWSAALLSAADQERHGVDLFGRDALLLGRVIVCQGTFVECAAPAGVTLRLAAALLELLAAPEVHAHAEPYVRRSALIAVSQVMGAMPAAGLAGLLSGGSVAEGTLVERLEWVRAWTEAAAAADPDPQCRALANACRGLQAKLAQEAMQALELGADGGMRQALHQAPEIIIPPSSSVHYLA